MTMFDSCGPFVKFTYLENLSICSSIGGHVMPSRDVVIVCHVISDS